MHDSDTVARLEGHEFAIVLRPIARPGDASRLAARIIETANQPIDLGRHWVSVSATAASA